MIVNASSSCTRSVEPHVHQLVSVPSIPQCSPSTSEPRGLATGRHAKCLQRGLKACPRWGVRAPTHPFFWRPPSCSRSSAELYASMSLACLSFHLRLSSALSERTAALWL